MNNINQLVARCVATESRGRDKIVCGTHFLCFDFAPRPDGLADCSLQLAGCFSRIRS
jgi:hypothetical protein